MSKNFNFVYQTKNLINEKTYIGVHCTNNLNDGYIGNGIRNMSSCLTQYRNGRKPPFISAVKKYGYKNFKSEILCFFDTRAEAYEEEEFLVNYDWVKNKNNYNVALGGMHNKVPCKLYDFKEEINIMFSDHNTKYEDISIKFNVSKSAWLSLISEETKIKRKSIKKDSFYKGLKVININGDEHELIDDIDFFKKTNLNRKTIHKLLKNDYCNGWYIKGSDKFIKKYELIKDLFILVNDKKVSLKEVYSIGVLKYSKKYNINEHTLEKKISEAKKKSTKK